MKSISVFLPAYNEEGNIEKVVSEIDKYLKKIFIKYEIIIINDGSTDKTEYKLKSLKNKYRHLKYFTHSTNKGYGRALITGFEHCQNDLIFFTDADLQYNIHDLDKFLTQIDQYDAVIGYRRRRESFIRTFNAFGWSRLMYHLFGYKFKDIDCAFKLFHKSLVDSLSFKSNGAMISAELLIKISKKKAKILELPVGHTKRRIGKPTGALFKTIIKAFKELYLSYRYLR